MHLVVLDEVDCEPQLLQILKLDDFLVDDLALDVVEAVLVLLERVLELKLVGHLFLKGVALGPRGADGLVVLHLLLVGLYFPLLCGLLVAAWAFYFNYPVRVLLCH